VKLAAERPDLDATIHNDLAKGAGPPRFRKHATSHGISKIADPG
jgi:hypothetical protein